MEGDKELKAWDAIARYMKSFDDTDGNGISNVQSIMRRHMDVKL